ncbi:hypothetical protein S83_047159, partial [Arachis hypogaea]
MLERVQTSNVIYKRVAKQQGSLGDLTASVASNAAAPARAHLHAIRIARCQSDSDSDEVVDTTTGEETELLVSLKNDDLEAVVRQSSEAAALFVTSGGMRAIVELLIPQLQFLDDEGAQVELWELSRIFLDTLIAETECQVKGETNISYICSRFYCAPELIFSATEYTTSIDIWSAGCVLAELLLGQVLGTPTREEVRCMNPNYNNFKFPRIKAHPWHKLEACAHPFFDELREPNARLPNGHPFPPLFNFKQE